MSDLVTGELDIASEAIGIGKVVAVMPCANPVLAPVMTITGHGDLGYYITIADGYGTPLWSVRLFGREGDPHPSDS